MIEAMLTEHERQDGPEEGEYHFSDEGGYESSEEEAKAPVVSESSGLAAKFSSYRRFVILGAIAAGVLLIAYLLIPPLTTLNSTPTEITAVNTPPLSVTTPTKTVAEAPTPPPAAEHKLTKEFSNLITAEKEKIVAEKDKVMAHLKEQPPIPPPALETPSSQTELGSRPRMPAGQMTTVEPALTPSAGVPSAIGSPMTQEFITSPIESLAPSAAAARAAAENKATIDRLTAMAETNTKLIGQMHVEYAQKVADYEAQNKALQEQVHTLNTRLAGMEAAMSKLVQALNNKPPAAASAVSNDSLNSYAENTPLPLQGSSPSSTPLSPPPVSQGYRSSYTVQAIIPGRAWLRTDSGETITVAEGDMLKSLGRVTKIDPYDGTILIDTGGKVLTLTYGSGDYT